MRCACGNVPNPTVCVRRSSTSSPTPRDRVPRRRSPPSRCPRSWRWRASRRSCRAGRSTTGRSGNCATRRSSGRSWTDISVSQVGRFLQQAAVQPHRKKMWLNTTEKDPQKFQAEVENVCRTYLEAPAKAAADGTHTVSVDEATSLQAIERNAPDKPAQPDSVAEAGIRIHPARDDDADRRSGRGDGDDRLPDAGGDPHRTGVRRAHRPDRGHRPRRRMDLRGRLPQHAHVGKPGEVRRRTLRPARRAGKKNDSGILKSMATRQGIPGGYRPPDPLRLPPEAQFVAQPDRDRLRDHPPEAAAGRKLHVGGGPGIAVAGIHGLLQRHDGPPLRLDLHRQAGAEATPRELRRTAPPPQTGQKPATGETTVSCMAV